ncbi:MAG TPA: alkaline phosphatase [Verrucomicrobiales bacterium]|nr:alkaline phosphatase [Verrucomicrobiales bacterium]
MKQSTRRRLLQAGLFGGVGSLLPVVSAQALPKQTKRVHGIVFMVSDGMSHGVLSLAEAFSLQTRKRSTCWWEMLQSPATVQGLMDTASSNSLVPDSAAAASAWGGGRRVPNGHINFTDKGRPLDPIGATLRAENCRLGLVTTATVTHATPAGFAASSPDRNDEEDIAIQYLDRADIVLGGGSKFFESGKRKDKRDLFAGYANAGYKVLRSRDELLATRGWRLLGTFTPGYLPYSVDRAHDRELLKKIPTLAEMAEAALKRLLGDGAPFLLQVEAARVDHAAHANDIAGLLWDQLAFDDAIAGVAAATAGRDDILVIITSDHGNANPGLNGMGSSYRRTNDHFARIHAMKSSHERLFAGWKERKGGARDLASLIRAQLGFETTEKEAKTLIDTISGTEVTEWNHLLANPQGILGQIAGNHTGIGWTGTVHTADPTIITAFGPQAERFHGLLRNDSVHERLLGILIG